MKKWPLSVGLALAAALGMAAAMMWRSNGARTVPLSTSHAEAGAKTRAVVDAATTFLTTLNAEQRGKVQLAFAPQKSATLARFARTGSPGGSGSTGSSGGSAGPGGPTGPGGPGGPSGSGGPGEGGARDGGPAPRLSPPLGPSDTGPKGDASSRGASSAGPGGGNMGPGAGFIGERYGDAVWSNYPVSDVPRPGVQLGSLNAEQRTAAMGLLQTLLSPAGYQKVLDIMGADQALSEGGTNYASGRDVYTIGIFGAPSATAPWMVELGGHHLGLNVVIAGDHGVMTPTLTGAQPSVYTVAGKTVRVLAEENDRAFSLLAALDEPQRTQATLSYVVNDLVLGPGHAGETIVPEGLNASAMTAAQRTLLLDLIAQWAGILDTAYAGPRMEELKAGLDETYFAWSGPSTHAPGRNGSSYYRIQGPRVFIEFSPQGVGGDSTLHVHTMYRDPRNDYGALDTLRLRCDARSDSPVLSEVVPDANFRQLPDRWSSPETELERPP